MKKRILVLSLLFSIIVTLMIPPKEKASAVTGAVARVVVGEVGARVIGGLAEKSGLKYVTKTARAKAVERWNLEMYEKIKYYDDLGKTMEADQFRNLQNALKNPTVSAIPEKPGFGKVVLDSALFLTGLDLVVDVYDSIQQHQAMSSEMDAYKELADAVADTESVRSIGGYSFFTTTPDDGRILFGIPSFFSVTNAPHIMNRPWSAKINSHSISGATLTVIYSAIVQKWNSSSQTYTNTYWNNQTVNIGVSNFVNTAPKIVSYIPQVTNLPQVTNIPWVREYADTGVAPQSMPKTVEVIVPLDESYPEDISVPWNEPLTEIPTDPVLDPEPETPPPDGGILQIDWSWWQWLKDLLNSMLDFIEGIYNGIVGFVSGVVNGIVSGIESIFVPDSIAVNQKVETLKNKFELKLPYIPKLLGFFGDIKEATFGNKIPSFTVTFPVEWGGGTYSIIDFHYFTDYRQWILNFIRFSTWFVFLRRLYNKVPRLIY